MPQLRLPNNYLGLIRAGARGGELRKLALQQQERTGAQIRHSAKNSRHAKRARSDGTVTKGNWDAMCQLAGGRCLCCKEVRPLTQDHVQPVSRGGWHSIYNLQPLCAPGNSTKYTDFMDYRPQWWPW